MALQPQMFFFFQCISQRWFSVWASRWPVIGLTFTPPPTLHCGELFCCCQVFVEIQLQSFAQVLLFFFRPPGSEHQVLNPWVTINLVVALLVGLAWIFIGFKPEKDFTEGQWEGITPDFSWGLEDRRKAGYEEKRQNRSSCRVWGNIFLNNSFLLPPQDIWWLWRSKLPNQMTNQKWMCDENIVFAHYCTLLKLNVSVVHYFNCLFKSILSNNEIMFVIFYFN